MELGWRSSQDFATLFSRCPARKHSRSAAFRCHLEGHTMSTRLGT